MDDELLRRRQERRNAERRRKQAQRRLRNRIIIVAAGILILILFIWCIVALFSSCSGSDNTATANQQATQPTEIVTQPPTQAPTQPPVKEIKDNGKDGVETDAGIYIWDNKGFEEFFGGEEAAKNYAANISNYKKQLGSKINVYNMVVPVSTEYGLPDRLKSKINSLSNRDFMTNVFNNYTSDVKAVDIYDALNQHKTEYIYFGTDHHWTGLGAYYAYNAFADVANFKPADIKDFESHDIKGFLGSLYTATGSQDLESHPDTVTYYDMPGDYKVEIMMTDSDEFTEVGSINYGDAEGSNAYGAFIWGDNPLMKITKTEPENNKKILVVKESFGNAFVPFLINNYDEVHAIDFRHFTGNIKTYCEENGITDVLFLNGVMSAATAFQVDEMTALFG